MADSKLIKVHRKTHSRLLRIMGEIQQSSDERVTLEKAILRLMDVWGERNGSK
ncbi:MAG: hypothetical protein ABIJ92_04920 [Candidatus Aenigmatarchaeota archaeon]